jgi:glycosyltransferase involved in cell wall biosynthesis
MNQRFPLSVSLITLNEEANLPRCLESIRELATEIVVVDSGSTDGTEEIARNAGAVFISQPWQGFNRQKNLSLDHCTQAWALCLDADEAVSPELANSIRQALASHPAATGFFLNRRTRYLDDWIWHAWYPEWRLRLVRRETAHWVGADPHPSLETTGPTEKLPGDLLHYSYSGLQDHFERTIRYARISADSLDRVGRRCRWYHLVVSPWLALGKRLLLKRGFRDGRRGWIIAYATFFSVLAKYAFLLEKQTLAGCSQERPPSDSPSGESSKSHSPLRPRGQ